jgi:hypothetical protein
VVVVVAGGLDDYDSSVVHSLLLLVERKELGRDGTNNPVRIIISDTLRTVPAKSDQPRATRGSTPSTCTIGAFVGDLSCCCSAALVDSSIHSRHRTGSMMTIEEADAVAVLEELDYQYRFRTIVRLHPTFPVPYEEST